MDFGCVRAFKSPFVKGVIDLYKALRDGDPTLAVHAYETWGFDNLSQELIDVLNIWAQIFRTSMSSWLRLSNPHVS